MKNSFWTNFEKKNTLAFFLAHIWALLGSDHLANLGPPNLIYTGGKKNQLSTTTSGRWSRCRPGQCLRLGPGGKAVRTLTMARKESEGLGMSGTNQGGKFRGGRVESDLSPEDSGSACQSIVTIGALFNSQLAPVAAEILHKLDARGRRALLGTCSGARDMALSYMQKNKTAADEDEELSSCNPNPPALISFKRSEFLVYVNDSSTGFYFDHPLSDHLHQDGGTIQGVVDLLESGRKPGPSDFPRVVKVGTLDLPARNVTPAGGRCFAHHTSPEGAVFALCFESCSNRLIWQVELAHRSSQPHFDAVVDGRANYYIAFRLGSSMISLCHD